MEVRASSINTKVFEGISLVVYEDKLGIKSVGFGHNMEKSGSKATFLKLGLSYQDILEGKKHLTVAQAEALFDIDYKIAKDEANSLFTNLKYHPKIVQDIIIDLSYNLGKTKLSKFVKTIAAFNEGDYKKAATELKDSKWFYQVGYRSHLICNTLNQIDR